MIESRIKITKALIVKLSNKYNTKDRFFLVGIWNTIFGYSVFILLDNLFKISFTKRYYAYMSAMILSQAIAIMNAYIFHKYVTFKSKAIGKEKLVEFLRFCLTYVVIFCLSLILLPLFVEIINIPPKTSAFIIILICTIISYIGHSRFSFKIKNKFVSSPE